VDLIHRLVDKEQAKTGRGPVAWLSRQIGRRRLAGLEWVAKIGQGHDDLARRQLKRQKDRAGVHAGVPMQNDVSTSLVHRQLQIEPGLRSNVRVLLACGVNQVTKRGERCQLRRAANVVSVFHLRSPPWTAQALRFGIQP
jgi:hypothetical protein